MTTLHLDDPMLKVLRAAVAKLPSKIGAPFMANIEQQIKKQKSRGIAEFVASGQVRTDPAGRHPRSSLGENI